MYGTGSVLQLRLHRAAIRRRVIGRCGSWRGWGWSASSEPEVGCNYSLIPPQRALLRVNAIIGLAARALLHPIAVAMLQLPGRGATVRRKSRLAEEQATGTLHWRRRRTLEEEEEEEEDCLDVMICVGQCDNRPDASYSHNEEEEEEEEEEEDEEEESQRGIRV